MDSKNRAKSRMERAQEKDEARIEASSKPLKIARRILFGTFIRLGVFNLVTLFFGCLTVFFMGLFLASIQTIRDTLGITYQISRHPILAFIMMSMCLFGFIYTIVGLKKQTKVAKINIKRVKTIRQAQQAQAGSISMSVDAVQQGALTQHQNASSGSLSQAQAQTAFDFDEKTAEHAEAVEQPASQS